MKWLTRLKQSGGTKQAVVIGAACLLVIGSLAAGCTQAGKPTAKEASDPGAAESGQSVAVELDEWSVTAEPAEVEAGSIAFTATNNGKETHELVIQKDGKELKEVEDIKAGTTGTLTMDLEAGEYEIVCNIEEKEEDGTIESHFDEGMHTKFTVK